MPSPSPDTLISYATIATGDKPVCVNTTRDLGAMNQWLTSRKIVREAALIADRMGLRAVRTLEVQDIIDIWNAGKAKGLTDGISKKDEHSF